MADMKKDDDKIADITDDKELNEKELQEVSGGMRPRSDDCGGNCMGSVSSSTGKNIEG